MTTRYEITFTVCPPVSISVTIESKTEADLTARIAELARDLPFRLQREMDRGEIPFRSATVYIAFPQLVGEACAVEPLEVELSR